MKHRPRGILLLFVGLGIWLSAAWINLYRFSLPWMDTWCYLAPAAARPSPFHLQTPLLGGFAAGDHTWGLHFPGAPLIYSCVFSLIGFRPSIAALMFLSAWIALAVLTGRLVFELTRTGFWAIAAAAIVLCDRSLFAICQAQRPELFGSIDVLVVWLAIAGLPPFRGRFRFLCAACGCYLLPLLHPVTLAAGAGICLFLAVQSRRGGEERRKLALVSWLGYASGGLTLFLWFRLQPDAWSQFVDHASVNMVPFSYGLSFWRALQGFYYPTFTGHLLWVTSLVAAAAALYSWLGGRSEANPASLPGAVILITCMIAHQKFHNGFYLGLYFPEAVVIALLLAHEAEKRGAFAGNPSLARFCVCLFIAVHGLFWTTRTLKFWQSGRPRVRTELAQIVGGFPERRKVLIPEVLWEAALDDPARFSMNTLPNGATSERRKAYEGFAYGRLSPGDFAVVDRFQAFQPMVKFGGRDWTFVGNFRHVFPGRSEWGYELTIWRKN